MILIISQENDIHVKAVVKHLSSDYFILDTGDYPKDIQISINPLNNYVSLRYRGTELDLTELKSIWYRRPLPVKLSKFNGNVTEFIKRESQDTLFGFFWELERRGVRIYNHPYANYTASIKPLQYRIAVENGLKIPSTYIGNDPIIAERKLDKTEDCVIKGVSLSWAIDTEADKHYSIFIKKANQHSVDNIKLIKNCPATIQNYIDKSYDIRVVIIDKNIFSYEIHAHNSDKIEIDWRYGDQSDKSLSYKPHKLDEKIRKSILNFMQSMELRFGAMDFSMSKKGEYFFLEINPNGQWLWLDDKSSVSLVKEFARCLEG